MSKGRRSRRPGGHPAKVAERRDREVAKRSRGATSLETVARRIVREVEGLTGALDAELWASHLVGAIWNQRASLPLDEFEDYALIYGEPLVEALARLGGAGARTALTIIAAVDGSELGALAGEFAQSLPGRESEQQPLWLAEVGDSTITAGAVMRETIFDDGFTVFLEARHSTGDTHAVGVHIDNNFGGMAMDILLADSVDRVAEVMGERPEEYGELAVERVDPGVAGAQIRAALDRTERTLDPPVSDEYPALRALALLRADEAPGAAAPPEPEEVPAADRDALREEFLASPEGREFAPDGDGAFAVSLAIDFCAGYVDGRPLRWSPSVVELFMSDWVPRKVVADDGLFAALPAALDAWIRFAGRKRDMPGWAIEATREEIPRWRDEMISLGSDPDVGGPTKQFLSAAKTAGIDVEDPDALATFIAGWNARSIAG
jgi:hypothetical protein